MAFISYQPSKFTPMNWPLLNVCHCNNDNYNGIIEAKTLQVSNIGLGSLKAFSSEDCELNEELVTLGKLSKTFRKLSNIQLLKSLPSRIE